jgi:4'-phosphopantetheinyl transferase
MDGLSARAPTLAAARELLTSDELARGRRIQRPTIAAYRLLARAALRLLLGYYLEVEPRALALCGGPGGRPELDPAGHPWEERGLSFNLAHTGSLAVFAFTRFPAIGVDVESVARRPVSPTAIRRALAPEELEVVMGLPEWERTAAFLRYWTAKEAYAKALGVGLSIDLRSVVLREVDDPVGSPRLDLRGGGGDWHVRRLAVRPDAVGAVVFGTGGRVV